jgi:hypothetical protein
MATPEQIAQASLDLAKKQFEWQKQQAEERKRNIRESMASIDELFSGRGGIHDLLQEESRMLNMGQLGDLSEEADRQTNFSLARAGTTGGSAEIGLNQELARRMGLGTAQAEIYAQSQADQLKAQDEALRGSLMGLAGSGGVTGQMVRGAGADALKGLSGTAAFMPNINNTFAGLTQNIGTAGQQQSGQSLQSQAPRPY